VTCWADGKRDLPWEPLGTNIRCVAVDYPARGSLIPMTFGLTLEALDIVRLFGYRFVIKVCVISDLHTPSARPIALRALLGPNTAKLSAPFPRGLHFRSNPRQTHTVARRPMQGHSNKQGCRVNAILYPLKISGDSSELPVLDGQQQSKQHDRTYLESYGSYAQYENARRRSEPEVPAPLAFHCPRYKPTGLADYCGLVQGRPAREQSPPCHTDT
jgi:hypothetical protein